MARPRGTRSPDFLAKRDALLERIAERLAAPDGHLTGMRALAEAAGVTYPTLRHYFGSREGVLTIFFETRFQQGQGYLQQMAQTELPFAQSVTEAAHFLVAAASQPQFMALHEIGLREGISTGRIGAAYLGAIFEPTLQAIERRLEHHMAAGEMQPVNARMAAMALLAPLLLGALHQHSLEGGMLRPLAMHELADQLAATFVRAHLPPDLSPAAAPQQT